MGSFCGSLAAESYAFIRGGRKAWRLDGRVILEQFEVIGTASVPVVLVTALFTGMVLALQASITLEVKLKGVTQFIGRTVALPFIRELGPVLTGLIVAGRIGSAPSPPRSAAWRSLSRLTPCKPWRPRPCATWASRVSWPAWS